MSGWSAERSVDAPLQISVLDDSCTRPSPCKKCPRRLKDKLRCSGECEQLAAYRENLPYSHLPTADKVKQSIPPQMKLSGTHKKCLISDCLADGTYTGLCQCHYQQWRRGKRLHPELGEWVPGRRKSTKGTYKHRGQYLVVDWDKVRIAYNKKHRTRYKVLKSLIKTVYTEQRIMVRTATELGISHAVLLKKMKQLGIERFKKGHRGKPAGLELILQLGNTSGLLCREIAQEIGMSQPYVWRLCRKHKIAHK